MGNSNELESKTDLPTTSKRRKPFDITDPSISRRRIGIWEFITMKEPLSSKIPGLHWIRPVSLTLIHRFLQDVYSLHPLFMMIFVITKIWNGMRSGIALNVSGNLLMIIETCIREEKADVNAIMQALGAQIALVLFSTMMTRLRDQITPRLSAQVRLHFEEVLLRENIRYDVPTLHHDKKRHQVPQTAWYKFLQLVDLCSDTVGFFTLLTSIFYHRFGGIVFALLCITYSVSSGLLELRRNSLSYVAYSKDEDYLDLRGLQALARTEYREDIVNGNLADYIVRGYSSARKRLGHALARRPEEEFDVQYPLIDFFYSLCGEMPMIYCAFCVMLDPSTFQLSAIAILQQQSEIFYTAVQQLIYQATIFFDITRTIEDLYSVQEVEIVSGTVEYPNTTTSNELGMSFELRNVSFSYPGSKSLTGALKDVSFSIKPGQLVIIVGANGSGKSTIIKLLTRLYDVTSGEILVDGLPIQDYKISDLHDATATLTQNNHIYPLSLAKNIGLGCPASVEDTEMVKEAAKQGGADELIDNLAEGFDTTLDPVRTAYSSWLEIPKYQPLQDIVDNMELQAEISGGERQRVVASRTFMRLRSPKIKFIAIDEPSSALDPRGEFELFDRLRAANTGKTTIFVTHRFGHLTKFADLIICMKNGQITETGTHTDLLALNGEYATLYNIQAQAFIPVQDAAEQAANFS